jgi:DNA polymerase (family 10)
MENREIAGVLDEVADLLEIAGDNFFRVRAYRNAARVIGDFPAPVGSLSQDQLDEIPGIGADLAAKIASLARGEEIEIHRELLKKVPKGLLELRTIRGLGPKRIKILSEILHVRDRASLHRAAAAGQLHTVRGLGKKLEDQIIAAASERAAGPARMMLADAEPVVAAIIEHMRAARGIRRIEAAGSFRRRRDTVGDLDILAASANPASAMDQFASFAQIATITGRGGTKASAVLASGLQVDLRVVEPASFGAALLYFTGSKAHNIHLRKIAQAKNLTLNEYGLMRGDRAIASRTEESIYRELGLPWIPPEIREDRGEIEAAAQGKLPHLIERKDLRGDLHAHSTWTDGRATIEEMARAAKSAGLEYFALTDHSQRLKMAHGLDPARLREQWREIAAVQKRVGAIRILRGIEVDILDNGRLDLPDAVLAELDWVVASVHSKLDQDSAAMTRRMIAAIRNPNVDAIGHPSGRILGRREPSRFDLEAVIAGARDAGCALEVNSQTERLDLDDVACLAVRRAGVSVVISSDSHSTAQFDGLRFGVMQARRGWIEPSMALNTMPAEDILARRRSAIGAGT